MDADFNRFWLRQRNPDETIQVGRAMIAEVSPSSVDYFGERFWALTLGSLRTTPGRRNRSLESRKVKDLSS